MAGDKVDLFGEKRPDAVSEDRGRVRTADFHDADRLGADLFRCAADGVDDGVKIDFLVRGHDQFPERASASPLPLARATWIWQTPHG